MGFEIVLIKPMNRIAFVRKIIIDVKSKYQGPVTDGEFFLQGFLLSAHSVILSWSKNRDCHFLETREQYHCSRTQGKQWEQCSTTDHYNSGRLYRTKMLDNSNKNARMRAG